MTIDEGKEAAIRGLHAYEDELHAQIARMQEDLHHVRRTIELLSGDSSKVVPLSGKVEASVSCEGSLSVTRYSQLKAQAAVELFLEENRGRWYKTSTVTKELLRRGVPKTSKAFNSVIAGALNRAVKKGLAKREKRNGVLMYQLPQEPQEPTL